jgi:hypothetical protein
LIQILRIKARQCVNAAFAAAKAGRVNFVSALANGAKAASGNADTAFRRAESGNRRARRFTAR